MTLTKQDISSITGIVREESRKIVNGQSAMKSELLGRISKLQNDMDKKFGDVDRRFDKVDKKFAELTKRIDKIGLAVARLEDDAPTVEEFDKLEKRVIKVEQKVASV